MIKYALSHLSLIDPDWTLATSSRDLYRTEVPAQAPHLLAHSLPLELWDSACNSLPSSMSFSSCSPFAYLW